jgi:hypothetical protein
MVPPRKRTERWFAFAGLPVFTPFRGENGDDESIRVLTAFRGSCGPSPRTSAGASPCGPATVPTVPRQLLKGSAG